jgi:hypothetical protein
MTHSSTTVSTPRPVPVAEETWLIPHLVPAGPGAFLPVNSLVIRGAEPVIVDTGAPIHRESWLEQVFSLVEPADVRWIFLSHDDGDHRGGLQDILARCPQATLVTNWFATERIALEEELPLDRMVWLDNGDAFHAGHRELRLLRPPIFEPTTAACSAPAPGCWAVGSFAALARQACVEASRPASTTGRSATSATGNPGTVSSTTASPARRAASGRGATTVTSATAI